jgi:hypothetical protein
MISTTLQKMYRPERVADAGYHYRELTTAVIRVQISASLPAAVAVRYQEVGVFAKTRNVQAFGVLSQPPSP